VAVAPPIPGVEHEPDSAVTPPMVAALLAAESMEKIMLGTKSNAVSFTLFVIVGKNAQPSGHGSPYPQSVVSYGDPQSAYLREAVR
jgi:hypothetical protein